MMMPVIISSEIVFVMVGCIHKVLLLLLLATALKKIL